MNKKCIIFVLFLLSAVIPFFRICVHAHPGDTDSNGGHYVDGTDEYHYHHGYPAHDHYDMDGDGDIDCPYDFNDNADHYSGKSDSTLPQSPSTSPSAAETEVQINIPLISLIISLAMFVYSKIANKLYTVYSGLFVFLIIAFPFWLLFLVSWLYLMHMGEGFVFGLILVCLPSAFFIWFYITKLKPSPPLSIGKTIAYAFFYLVFLSALFLIPGIVYYIISLLFADAHPILQWIIFIPLSCLLIWATNKYFRNNILEK